MQEIIDPTKAEYEAIKEGNFTLVFFQSKSGHMKQCTEKEQIPDLIYLHPIVEVADICYLQIFNDPTILNRGCRIYQHWF